MAQLKGILFDKDGTLVHFGATWNPALLEVMRAQARGDLAALERLAAMLDFDLAAGALRETSGFVGGSWAEYGPLWAQALRHRDPAALLGETQQLVRAALARHAAPVGDPAALMALLARRGLKFGIATNDSEAAARDLAAQFALPALDFFAGYDSGHGAKPGPGMVLAFARHIGAAPAEIAMVGDSTHDLHAARAAGALAVGVLTGPARRGDLAAHADHVIATICELPRLLDDLALKPARPAGARRPPPPPRAPWPLPPPRGRARSRPNRRPGSGPGR